MSEDNQSTDEENIGDVAQSPLIIHKQYLKDLSFEAPNSPFILKPHSNRPEMNMNIMLDVQKLEHEKFENFYEVVLNITARATREENTMFIVEASYAATVSIIGVDDKKHHPLLFIEVPTLLFPFARQIIAHSTQAGGFTALQLVPVDFRTMYIKRFAEETEQNSD